MEDPSFSKIDINLTATALSEKISMHYWNIGNLEDFDRSIKSELEPYSPVIEYLEIVDLNGNIVYNSIDRYRIGKTIDMKELVAYSNSLFNFSVNEKDSNFHLKVIKPIAVEGSIKGFALIKQNPYNLFEYAKTIAYPILWFGVGSIILVIVFFSWLISRGIIVPLRELSLATEHISEGNLDFEINYKAEDELGTLCQAFETMRGKLKDSLIKQMEYENSRKELVASISHDLRTPLTSIKGYVEGLRDGIVKDPNKFKQYLDVIYNKTESMNNLIDDLFLFSRLDLNSIEIEIDTIESRKMIEDIIDNVKYDVEKENLSFKSSIDFDTFYIKADRKRIEQVLNNLVSNALRYAVKKIELGAYVKDGSLIVSISDDGCGLKKGEEELVFQRFYRSDKSRPSKTGGAGLGLAIAKKIIDAHGGNIWVESTEGKGSTFYFSIPGQKTNL